MSSPDAESADSKMITLGGKSMPVEQALLSARSYANWFWWIAALSIVNTVATATGSEYGMLIGLGVTQVVDALVLVSLGELSGAAATVAKLIQFSTIVLAAGFFWFVGVKARQHKLWAFSLGIAAYALDALIFLVFQDWIGLGFHAFVLFMLMSGRSMAAALIAAGAVSPLKDTAEVPPEPLG